MIRLDHLVLVAPSLAEGVAHVRETLGVEMPFGGRHPRMGTYNHLLRLQIGSQDRSERPASILSDPAHRDDVFLEVIAIDPEAPAPGCPRWFGLDDRKKVRADWDRGHRLKTWVASTDDLAGVLKTSGTQFGTATAQMRGALSWQFALPEDGALIMDGALPYLIEWSDHRNPAYLMPDLGCRLESLEIAHPEANSVQGMLSELAFQGPIKISEAAVVTIEASIRTADGVMLLR